MSWVATTNAALPLVLLYSSGLLSALRSTNTLLQCRFDWTCTRLHDTALHCTIANQCTGLLFSQLHCDALKSCIIWHHPTADQWRTPYAKSFNTRALLERNLCDIFWPLCRKASHTMLCHIVLRTSKILLLLLLLIFLSF